MCNIKDLNRIGMSDSLEAVTFDNQLKDSRYSSKVFNNNNHKSTLRSKENYFKSKCNKELKKKLRKYKLRRDGSEDPEVLDVSQILVTSLRIKSPNNPDKISNNNNILEIEDPKPTNYLFKMVRKRKVCAQLKSNNSVNDNILPNGNDIQPILQDEASQTNKQNAFKMMMESRNKSIGSNSPGKEKCIDETVLQEITEKKVTKAKRILSLQKMAESKGSLKNKEIEEYREKTIKKKMLKRAELFKEMITKQDKYEDKNNSITTIKSETISNKQTIKEMEEKPKNIIQTNKTLKLCDIFSDTNTFINENKLPKQLEKVSDEDIEFLNKLSPSIRKKENMLCYFKKVTKVEEELVSEQNENNCSDESSPVIKVKFTPKRKKKAKTLKLIKEDSDSIAEENSIPTEDLVICSSNKTDKDEHTDNSESRKRKRNRKVDEISTPTTETQNSIESSNSENRPKRNTKKPVKYTEDVHCLSSDEELHIFTPKKKKNNDNLKSKSNKIIKDKKTDKDSPTIVKENESILLKDKVKLEIKKSVKDEKNVTKKSSNSTKVDEKKPVKLAPIFFAKPQLSQAALEAKQKFLQSGVPEKLKKTIAPQLNTVTSSDNFCPVFHIQQNESFANNYYSKDWFKASEELEGVSCDVNNYPFKSFLTTVTTEVPTFPILKHKPDKVLKCIKSAYPKFPVYRTYHRLRSKSKGDFKDINYTDLDNSVEIIDSCPEVNNDNPEKLNWCDKYKSTSSKQMIGNFESVKELKRWLETWSEKLIKAKTTTGDSSDMSDFYNSDVDSRDSMKSSNSVLILTGKTGTGKTSSVYAVAAELAIKVIEVNASSKRNGKIMLQDLQEATQSHKVDRGKSGSECSQKSQQVPPPLTYAKKRGRPKKTDELKPKKVVTSHVAIESSSQPSNQECIRTGMSLILIDDADIVFDQDDGFCSAISQLIHSSKRPVILVTSSLSCPHLQKFIQNGKILHMRPLIPRMLGTWLDIMCLADVGKCYMGLGERILDSYKGDIRKTINCLQFYMNSYRSGTQIEEAAMSQVRFEDMDDENSGMSWADTENLENLMPIEKDSYNIEKKLQLLKLGESNVFDVWWCLNSHFKVDNSEKSELSCIKKIETEKIRKLADVLNIISIIDYTDLLKEDRRINVISTPWETDESASLLETENFDMYDRGHFVNLEISEALVNGTTSEVQNVFKTGESQNLPSMGLYRGRDRLVSRHNTLSSYLNPSAILDRRATALDYWSGCRSICRIEKNKTDINIKRNNRFCHYLKSLNVLCRNDFFDNLADSLS